MWHSADSAGANATPIATFSVFNVQGLKPRTVHSKVPYLNDLLHQGNQLFIALSETWLRDHRDAEVRTGDSKEEKAMIQDRKYLSD